MSLKAPSKKQDPFRRLVKIMSQLRSPKGCPWDRKQTHLTLKPYLIEEAYEVLEAIDSKNPQALKGELGDLLLQAVFHAQVASEKKRFNIDDVVNAIIDKLVSRHPHVYGKASIVRTAEAQVTRWEEIKRLEKEHAGRKSVVDGVPSAMPALSQAKRVLSKAAKAHFQKSSRPLAWAELKKKLNGFSGAKSKRSKEAALGDALLALVNVARFEDLDPEHSLHQGVKKFISEVKRAEKGAASIKEKSKS